MIGGDIMLKLPKTYYKDLKVTCNKCGKITKIKVPYVCEQHDFPCDEVYIKIGIKPENLVYSCLCDGIKEKVNEEYLKMDSNFTVEH